MMAFGLSLFAVSCLELVPITKDWAFSELFIPQALRGVALMTSMMPVSMLALGTLPPERIKNASGLFNLTRNLGGAVGLAVITTILNESVGPAHQPPARVGDVGPRGGDRAARHADTRLVGARHECRDRRTEDASTSR